ncbi:BtpA/SgcQ family protein [Rhodococcus sp. 3Y1]
MTARSLSAQALGAGRDVHRHAISHRGHSPPGPAGSILHYTGQPVSEIARFAVEEAHAYVDNGFDGVIVENHWDIPFLKPGEHGYETAASMGVITAAVVGEFGKAVGVSILSNAGECGVAAAWAAGASFVRVNQWANAYIANEGFIEGQAAKTTRFRHRIGADPVGSSLTCTSSTVRMPLSRTALSRNRPKTPSSSTQMF